MKKDLILTLLLWTVVAALAYLFLLHVLLHGWLDPETGLFPDERMLVLPIVPGLLMLLVTTVLFTIPVSQHRRLALESAVAPARWYWLLLLLTGGICVAGMSFDWLYLELIDNTLPQAFADTVARMSLQNGRPTDTAVLNSFARMPLFAQNTFINMVTALLGSGAALLLARNLTRPAQRELA